MAERPPLPTEVGTAQDLEWAGSESNPQPSGSDSLGHPPTRKVPHCHVLERESMKIGKLWKVVLAATLIVWGLLLLDVLTFSSASDIVGIGGIASGVLLLLDK